MRWVLALCLMTGAAFARGAPAVTVSGAWARASLPHQDEAAAYLTLQSAGGDTLTGVESPAAGMVMLHQTVRKNGVAQMDDVDSLALPAGVQVALAPGGTHLMLMDVAKPLKAGDTLRVTLHFAKAGDLNVNVPILKVSATGPAR